MILGSTVGAVAAVLSYHPAANSAGMIAAPTPDTPAAPATTPTADNSSAPAAPVTPATPAPSQPSAQPTTSAAPAPAAAPSTTKPKAKSSPKSSASSKSSASASASTQNSTPAASQPATPAPSTPSSSPTQEAKATTPLKDQTVTGATAQTRWGPVQVQITVKDGKIVDAVGVQYPNGDRRSQWISNQAVPWLVEETLSEQIADVQIIGGATYTSMGWRQSLASALQKAGL